MEDTTTITTLHQLGSIFDPLTEIACLNEVVLTIRGQKHWLWRAIGADGDVLDILVQTRRNAKAAKRFFKRLVARFGEPRVVITDNLRSYVKPIKTLAPCADHRAHKGLINAIEVSHRSSRKRENIFGKFKSHRQAQRFLSALLTFSSLIPPRPLRCFQPLGWLHRRNGRIIQPLPTLHSLGQSNWQNRSKPCGNSAWAKCRDQSFESSVDSVV